MLVDLGRDLGLTLTWDVFKFTIPPALKVLLED